LSELADIYVLNRGSNTITRMRVDGRVHGTRKVTLGDGRSLGPASVTGIATSLDGKNIYVSVTGKLPGYNVEGALLELASFTQ
jgi:DNA-binding beta-propeller fold protein YncE